MNIRRWVKCIFFSFCTIAIAACSSTPMRESTGEYLDSSIITSKVLAKLAASKETSVAAINVETFKGIVQLSGFVSTHEEAQRAEQIAASVEGVQKVENKLSIIVGLETPLKEERIACIRYPYDPAACV